MPEKSWKVDERKVARRVGGQRVGLSGGRGAYSRADVLSDGWFIEVKRRAVSPVAKWLGEAQVKARMEGKKAVLVVHVARSDVWLVALPLDEFCRLAGLGSGLVNGSDGSTRERDGVPKVS